MTRNSGQVVSTAVAQKKAIDVSTEAAISKARAADIARGQLATATGVESTRLVVQALESTPRLAVPRSVVTGFRGLTPSRLHVFVDAKTGDVLSSEDEVKDGTGNSFYNGVVTIATSGSGSSFSMQDSTRPGIRCGGQNGVTFTGTDDTWGNASGTNLETACVDALYAVQREWDMLGAWLGRNGINGSGGGFPRRVGLNDANAFWNGSFTSFGHNSANTQQATSMDIVGHEFGHAIFQTTPGGSGSGNENGGINESTGDIFGALTEAFAANPNDPADFLVGEEVNLVGTGEIRNMFNPSAEGDPNCWSTAIPNTEVHAAAGPLNHWFYLVARGSNPAGGPASPTCNGSTVTGVGIQKAGQIYYNAMLAKTSTWRYANVRLASLNAAVNLFGASSPECATVKAAWNAISVPVQAGEPTCGGGGGTVTVNNPGNQTWDRRHGEDPPDGGERRFDLHLVGQRAAGGAVDQPLQRADLGDTDDGQHVLRDGDGQLGRPVRLGHVQLDHQPGRRGRDLRDRPEAGEPRLRVRRDRLERELRRDRPERHGLAEPADALGHLQRLARRLRPDAHRHGLGDDPGRLHQLDPLVLAAHRQRRDDGEHGV